jgi:hypothetical protein
VQENLEEVILTGLTPMKTKLQTLLDALKVPMLQTHPVTEKKTSTMFEVRQIMCVSSTNKGKTQVGWAIAVRRRVQK